MASRGLPPLPKSLSNASLTEQKASKRHRKAESDGRLSQENKMIEKLPPPPPAPKQPPPPPPAPKQPPPPPPRKQTKLDVQLARLRKEMFSLRELDLSLLSQLWSLNEALQEFRTLQEMMSPSSDNEDDPAAIYSNVPPMPLSSAYPLSSSSSSSNGFTTEL